MTIAAAVKMAIARGSDHHWKLELPDPERDAFYRAEATAENGHWAWRDAYRMECAEKYPEIRRLYQNMPVLEI
jgi:hypothetical protein